MCIVNCIYSYCIRMVLYIYCGNNMLYTFHTFVLRLHTTSMRYAGMYSGMFLRQMCTPGYTLTFMHRPARPHKM